MPTTGITSSPDLTTAALNLQEALRDFQLAYKGADLPRPEPSPVSPVFAALRAWRTEQARAKQVPPYIIASDAVLKAIETTVPQTLDDLVAIRGMGAAKIAAYGNDILQVVRKAIPQEANVAA